MAACVCFRAGCAADTSLGLAETIPVPPARSQPDRQLDGGEQLGLHIAGGSDRMATRTIGVMGRLLDQADGLGLFARHLLQHLVSLDTGSRYVVFLAGPAARGLFAGQRNVEVQVLPARNRVLWDQVLVPRAARSAGVDLLFNPKFSLPLFSRIPGVFVLQSSDWYVNPGNYPWWDNIYIRLMLPLYCRKARALLAISKTTLDGLPRQLKMTLPDTAITYAGVGPEFTTRGDSLAQQRFREEYGLPERFIL